MVKETHFKDFKNVNKNFEDRVIFKASLQRECIRLHEELKKNKMSYHIKLKKYHCKNCNTLFFPIEKDIPCPKCKTITVNAPEEYLFLIDELISNLKINMLKCGRYIPDAWYIGSPEDQIQSVVFDVFEKLRIMNRGNGEEIIDEYMNSLVLDGEHLYFKDCIKSICYKIYCRKDDLRIGFFTKLLSKIIP